jgi:CelD/BcsL family acetyltransferase involved in cellulose biosynthesis
LLRPSKPSAPTSAPEVSFVTSVAGLDALRPDWERCLERSEGASIFVTFEWLRAWWAHYGAGRTLRIAIARREGRVTGILPLYVGTASLLPGLPARVLRLLGSGADTSPDYLGPVVETEGAAETLAALCRAAARSPGWDAIELTDVLESSPFLPRMEEACGEAGMAPRRTPGSTILIARLPAAWPEYVATLSRDRAKNMRYVRRAWDKAGARFFTWAGDPPLDAVVDRLAELHRLRWEGRAEKHAFSSPSYIAFHRDVMHALAARGRLRLHCLAIGDALVAVYYCYAFGGEVSHFQSGFDPGRQNMSPGSAVMAFAIEQAIAEGARVFDMLKGEYPHKAIWANERRSTVGLRAYRTGVRGGLLRLRRRVGARLDRAAAARAQGEKSAATPAPPTR